MDNETKTAEELWTKDVLIGVIKRRIEEEQKWAWDTAVVLENCLGHTDDETSGFLNGVKYACDTILEFVSSIENNHLKEG